MGLLLKRPDCSGRSCRRNFCLSSSTPGNFSPGPSGRGCMFFTGVLLCVAMAAPWHVPRNDAYAANFRFYDAQRPGRVSLASSGFISSTKHVLAVFESALSAAITTTVAPAWRFWALHLFVAISVDRYSSGGGQAEFQARGPAQDRRRLLAVCWIGFVLVFFLFSPLRRNIIRCRYIPRLALLIGKRPWDADSNLELRRHAEFPRRNRSLMRGSDRNLAFPGTRSSSAR